jgi:hypothetical protein
MRGRTIEGSVAVEAVHVDLNEVAVISPEKSEELIALDETSQATRDVEILPKVR